MHPAHFPTLPPALSDLRPSISTQTYNTFPGVKSAISTQVSSSLLCVRSNVIGSLVSSEQTSMTFPFACFIIIGSSVTYQYTCIRRISLRLLSPYRFFELPLVPRYPNHFPAFVQSFYQVFSLPLVPTLRHFSLRLHRHYLVFGFNRTLATAHFHMFALSSSDIQTFISSTIQHMSLRMLSQYRIFGLH